MLETARRDIRRAVEAAELRRRQAAPLPGLVDALDDLLSELEELNVLGIVAAPDACRRRAAGLVAEAARLDTVPLLPGTVEGLMERIYEAQDAALLRRRRASWGLDEAAPRG